MNLTCRFVIGSPSFHGVSSGVVYGVNVVSKLSIVLSSLGSTPTVSNNGDASGLFYRFCSFGSKAVPPGVFGRFCSLHSPLRVLFAEPRDP